MMLIVNSNPCSTSNDSEGNSISSSNCLLSTKYHRADRFHTLKKRVLTRWNTILIMIRSYALNRSAIDVLLKRLNHFDLILSPVENEIVDELVSFLSAFESIVTILSASKSYPTFCLYLLLRIVSIPFELVRIFNCISIRALEA